MTSRKPLRILVLGAFVLLLAPQIASTAPPPAPPRAVCSPGPPNCFAWHNSNVTVAWTPPPPGVTASGCASVTLRRDTRGTPVSCTWSNADGSRTTTVTVRRDTTPPSVTASAERAPDADGWYNHPVPVAFSGLDALSGIASCTRATYSGPDTVRTSVPGSCTDRAGNTRAARFELKYDATAPTVLAVASRQPDAGGWYKRPVTVGFIGTDAVSNVDSCSQPVLYSGPDTEQATISGRCRDKAANKSKPVSFTLRYDTSPPRLLGVEVEVTDAGVVLSWRASADTHTVTVVRRPGLASPKPSTLYTGRAPSFTDVRLASGVTYRYTITVYDEAGNAEVQGVVVIVGRVTTPPAVAKPAPQPAIKRGLERPAPGARVRRPPLLAWTAVPRATYYNLQLYRDGRKILTVWPSRPSFALQRSWSHAGRRVVLTPGRYRWYVWPGFGHRSERRYGRLLGSRVFVVTR